MKQREFTEDFKREAVRILTTSGRSISSVAEDLGFGKSTLDRWRRNFAEKDLLSGPHEDMSQKLARLRKENKLLRQERDLLKSSSPFVYLITVIAAISERCSQNTAELNRRATEVDETENHVYVIASQNEP